MSNFEKLTQRALPLERHSDKLIHAWQWNDGTDVLVRVTRGQKGYTMVCAFMIGNAPMASCDVSDGTAEDVMEQMAIRMLMNCAQEGVS